MERTFDSRLFGDLCGRFDLNSSAVQEIGEVLCTWIQSCGHGRMRNKTQLDANAVVCAARREADGTEAMLRCLKSPYAIRAARRSAPAVLPIRCADEIRLVPTNDIWYCTRTRKATMVVASVGEFKVSKTLDVLEVRLAPYGFFRAHRAYLVNLQHVRSIMVWSRNAYTLMLHCNREIPLSKHRIGALREILGW